MNILKQALFSRLQNQQAGDAGGGAPTPPKITPEVQALIDSHVAGLKTKNGELIAAQEQLKEQLATFDGIDPNIVRNIIKRFADDEEAKWISEGTTINASTITTGSGTACTLTVPGKVTYIPDIGHTNTYYTVEEWYPDALVSERNLDVKFTKVDLSLPGSGNATIKFSALGLGQTSDVTAYFTSPAAESSTDVLTAASGVLLVNGAAMATVTDLSISIDGKGTAAAGVVGSNNLTEANFLDAVGEIANTLAGNARQVFGFDLKISVPTCLRGEQGITVRVRQRPYVITFRWNNDPALVCVDMERQD